jgi:4-amino-4-deoxy-L-arabinose transferase-like glycosyltransferase
MKKISFFSLLLIGVLILGAWFRIYHTINLPLLCDEKEFIQLAKNVSLTSPKPLAWLAKDSILGEHNMPSIYAIKLGMFIFGENLFGFRIFSALIFSILSLVLIYLYTVKSLGRGVAFFALFLISFEQYHLFHSAISTPHALRQFIILLTLIIFNKIQQDPSKINNFVFFGILSGIGYYTQPTFLLFLLILLLYLILIKGFAGIFRNKGMYIAILFMLITILPDLYWNRLSGAWHYFFNRQSYGNLRLSWTGLNFFIIEIINFFRGIDWRLLISWEHPIIRWYFGLIVIIGAFYSFRYIKNKLIALQLFIFFTVILIFSFFPSGEFWWANLAFIPGIILGAFMLNNLFLKRKIVWKSLVLLMLLSFAFQPFVMKINAIEPPLKKATFVDYDLT